MADDSNTWITRTATIYRALSADEEADSSRGRRRLALYLDLVMTDRLKEVGPGQPIMEVQEAISIAGR